MTPIEELLQFLWLAMHFQCQFLTCILRRLVKAFTRIESQS